MDVALLIVYLIIAIGFSFFCSIAEAVLLSITPSYLAERKNDPTKSAQRIVRLKEDIDKPLSAILSLNTIAHTGGAAGVGAQAQVVFGSGYVGITSAILTLMILFFSEIIPKTLGATHWRTLAPVSSRILKAMIWILYPFVVLSQMITRLLGDKNHITFSREELSAMADRGVEE